MPVFRKETVTMDNVVDLFLKYLVPVRLDLLVVDTDFNDWWIVLEILKDGRFRPRVIGEEM